MYQFGAFKCNKLRDFEYLQLKDMKHRRKQHDRYKIIITTEKGSRVGTFYFAYPNEFLTVVKAFKGLHYQLFAIERYIEDYKFVKYKLYQFGNGVIGQSIYDNWRKKDLPFKVCRVLCCECFRRDEVIDGSWTCQSSMTEVTGLPR